MLSLFKTKGKYIMLRYSQFHKMRVICPAGGGGCCPTLIALQPSVLCYRDEFVIPELPRGQHLVINILTTWGDRYYVGLNGIEIFSNTGELVTVTKVLKSSLGQIIECT